MSTPYSARGTVAADGTLSLTLGPTRGGERWKVLNMTVQNTSSAPLVTTQNLTAKVYRSAVVPSALIDGTLTGTFDTSPLNPVVELGSGENLVCKWENAQVGSFSTFTMDVESNR